MNTVSMANGQRPYLLIGVVVVLALVAGAFYFTQARTHINPTSVSKSSVLTTSQEALRYKTADDKFGGVLQQIQQREDKIIRNQDVIFQQLEVLVGKANQKTKADDKISSGGGNRISGEEWEKLLSFLHMDTVGLCEDVFKTDSGKDYSAKLSDYYKLVEEHDQHLATLNLTTIFKDFDGHSSNYREETYVMWAIAQLPFVKTVCETGFNAGHSAHLWLSVNPNAHVYAFDIAGFAAARPMAEYLQNKYPNRLTVTWGDSTKTLPDFIQKNPDVKCDLMVVDGGHEYHIATSDIKHFKSMARGTQNILFMDNYPDRRFGNKHARAWEQFKRRGEVLEIFQCHYQNLLQGFTFGRYVL